MTARDMAPAPGQPAGPYPGEPAGDRPPDPATPDDDAAAGTVPPPERFPNIRVRVARGVRRTLRIAVPLALLAVVSYGAGVVAAGLADTYGFHPERNREAWLGTVARYSGGGECITCHDGAVAALASAEHASIDCQTCHGPLAAHIANPDVAPVRRPVITRELPGSTAEPEAAPLRPEALTAEGQLRTCLTCHQRSVGRPADFPVIDPVRHFAGPPCITCHRPHTPEPLRPTPVRHPLDGLPACVTCHRVDGIRPMPANHPAWSGPCLDCHGTPAAAAAGREEG